MLWKPVKSQLEWRKIFVDLKGKEECNRSVEHLIYIFHSCGRHVLSNVIQYGNIFWLVRVILVVAFGFCPKMLGGVRDLRSILLSFYECRFSGGNTMRWWGHSNPTICQRIYLNLFYSKVWSGQKKFGCKHLRLASCSHALLALVLALTSHLVKLSLPNISFLGYFCFRTNISYTASKSLNCAPYLNSC